MADIVQVPRQRLGDRWQQRKREGHAGLWPHRQDGTSDPIDIVELQSDRLAGAEPIGAHQQKKSVIAKTTSGRRVYRTQKALHVLPWQLSARAFEPWRHRRNDRIGKRDGSPLRRQQKPAE